MRLGLIRPAIRSPSDFPTRLIDGYLSAMDSAAWDQFLPTVEVGTFGPSPSSRNS
jgi:hypothetical protein